MHKIIHTLLLATVLMMPISLKAQSTGMQVNVAVNDPVMGTTNPAPGVYYYAVGASPSVEALPNTGYHLMGWRIQTSVAGMALQDDTVAFPIADVFEALSVLNGGEPFVVGPQHLGTVFTMTALFEAGTVVPDSMEVNVSVNNGTMGTTSPVPGTYRYGVGDTVSVLATAYEGYHLTGWDIDVTLLDQNVLDTTINIPVVDIFPVIAMVLTGGNDWVVDPLYVNATISVTANFIEESLYIPDSMTVNVAVNNPAMGTTTPAPGVHLFAVGDTCHVAAVANPGYHLTGWDVQIIVGDAVAVDTTIDIAIRDVFDLVILIDELRTSGDISAFELIELLARPIGDWVVDPLYSQATFNLTANFAAGDPASTHITYAVMDHDTTMGLINPMGTHTINAGDPVIVEAMPKEGYRHSAWIMEYTYSFWGMDIPVVSDTIKTEDGDFANPARFLGVMQQMLDSIPQLGMYVTAVFEPAVHTVMVASADIAMGTVAPAGSHEAFHGEEFVVTATANHGYHFLGWVVEPDLATVSTEETFRFTVSDDISLIAVFAHGGYYTVEVNYDASKGNVEYPSQPVYEGTEVTLRAMPHAGYHFVSWTTENGSVVETDTLYTFIVTDDITLHANFELTTGIEEIDAQCSVYSDGLTIVASGICGEEMSVYDITGRRIAAMKAQGDKATVQVPVAGVYMVKIGNGAARRIVVK